MRQVDDNGLRFTAAWEDFSATPIFVTEDERKRGIRTIGHGHVILPGESFPRPITRDEALALLKKDLAKAEASVNKWAHPSINQAQFNALVDHVINGGDSSIREDNVTGDFDDMVRFGNWPEVSRRLLDFKYQSGVVMKGLVRRTTGRRALFEGDRWDVAEKKGRAVP